MAVLLTMLTLSGVVLVSANAESGSPAFLGHNQRSNWARVEKVSLPYSFTVTGCVKDGSFTSGRSKFQVESNINGKSQPESLDPYEGKTIQIDGMLSPGDRLTAGTFTIIDDRCRPDLYSSKFK
jgi:hypothetical protein